MSEIRRGKVNEKVRTILEENKLSLKDVQVTKLDNGLKYTIIFPETFALPQILQVLGQFKQEQGFYGSNTEGRIGYVGYRE